jgi:ubiquinol-cytochrome c reductase cytochrome b subunit
LKGQVPASASNSKSDDGRAKSSSGARCWNWIDQRTGVDRILRHSLDEPIPGGARFAYVFGSALLFIFVSQVVTGICMALYYVPAPTIAHVSVDYIVKEVAAGSFLRGLHSYGSSAMIIVLLMHFAQTFFYGSYKGKREILWMSGVVLALLVFGMAFTGSLLPWDQKGFFAGSVGSDIVGQVPLIGEGLRLLLRGGARMGALTLSRFYVLHVFIFPAFVFFLAAIHIALFRKAGPAGPIHEDPVRPVLSAEAFYPRQVLIDMGFALLVMVVLGVLSHFVPIMLGPEANPADSAYLPRPEWYFLPMFQWLKYWEGELTVIGIFVIPSILLGLLFLMPFLDRGTERRPWRRLVPVGGLFIVLVGLLWLGMMSRRADSRDSAIAARIARQKQQEILYFHSPFQPNSASTFVAGDQNIGLDRTATGPVAAPILSDSSRSKASAIVPADRSVATSDRRMADLTNQGEKIYQSYGCDNCHGKGGAGTSQASSLIEIGRQLSASQLTSLLENPTDAMVAGGMPPVALNDNEWTPLVTFLRNLKRSGVEAGGNTTTPVPNPQ